MASGKQGLFVVVWEWENKQRRWRPYPPEVTQQLERAHSKRLRTVFLGDSDPILKNYNVNISLMQQVCEETGEVVAVRRNFYPQSSPAGQGAVWQWAGDNTGDWHVYDMCVQCIIESEWATGARTVDMSKTFPLCPYIIDFCNLTQRNSRTGFVRGIRRIQQAAYPVGKRPTTPQQPQQEPSSSTHVDRLRRRGSRDEVDTNLTDGKPTGFFNKMFSRSTGGCTGSGSSNKSPTSFCESDDSRPAGVGGGSKGGRGNNIPPPKPLPRRQIPPVAKPRTNLPQHYVHQQHVDSHPAPPSLHLHHRQYQQDIDGQAMLASKTLRNENGANRYGSDRTLDSDCSSLSGRRQSVDTTSTYLSMEDDHNHNTKHFNHEERYRHTDTVVENLVRFDSDDEMADDVFSEDKEVCDVMRGIAGNSSSPRAPSPPPNGKQHSHPYYCHNASSPRKQNQSSGQHSYLFTPISPETDQPVNGVKRKRTGAIASSHPQHGASRNSLEGDSIGFSHQAQQHTYNQKSYLSSRTPVGPEDQLMRKYTKSILQPPDETCSICMCNFQESSGFSDDEDRSSGFHGNGVVSLSLCNHMFHAACIKHMVKSTPQFLECPNCKTMHGEKQGTQPEGKMKITYLPQSLPGYRGINTIQITYCINDGIQGPEHPHPGLPYRAIGFPRTAYLPNNPKGKKILGLLQEAFRRKLIFTIGTSVTTGIQDAVTWNEIHHKTEWSNATGHGYPDPNYLDNVLMELAIQGVSETTLV
ncbi:E3 ubiquitin-protein ligase DTX4 [Palaemon carinicauda]|uniref:E3 ubiquitin-protein ligase DTX4 n=1 Tax=Palaemon carinicauda TaxID=392227 RepID=UPI0035B61878